MHKEWNELCIVCELLYGCYHGLETVLLVRAYYFCSPRNQTTPIIGRVVFNLYAPELVLYFFLQ